MSSCCLNFWGPFRPFFFSESAHEVGGSFYAPFWVLVVSRLISGIFMITTSIVSMCKWYADAPMYWYQQQVWTLIFDGLVFLILSYVSLQCARSTAPSNCLARVVAPLHYSSCSLALVSLMSRLDGAAYSANSKLEPILVLPIVFVLIDFFLGAQTRFRIVYLLLPQLFFLPDSFSWIRKLIPVHATLYARSRRDFIWYVLWHGMLLWASFMMLLLCRVSDICFDKGFINAEEGSIENDQDQ